MRETGLQYLAIASALAVACARTAQPHPGGVDEPAPLGRLPIDVRPIRYALSLDLDPERDRFAGTADIAITLEKPRAVLWLHGRNLRVSEASLELPSGERLAADWSQVDESGVARLALRRCVGPGRAVLHFAWDAPFDPQLVGIYRTTAGGAGYVFSKFEATYARRAFPGFDEPAVKTPFSVTLVVPATDQAVSNAPELEQSPAGDGKKRVRFAETPPLPTYLLAFIAGRFDVVEAPLPPNEVRTRTLPHRGLAVRGNGPRLQTALRESALAIDELEHQFGIPFPYEKIDLIAVPDFQSGAMENAGAITFRDQLLLVDDATASLDQRKAVASTVTHELAHQWFGNLVTMKWWDDLWLNEGFATFIATRVLQAKRPELRPELDEVRAIGRVMDLDELVSARRIRQPILSTHDITNAFDDITYQKGAAILGMFERWAGPARFREGVRQDLRAHSHGNATTADLLAAVSAAAGRDLTAPFESFLEKPGVPLIEASVSCKDGRGILSLQQSRALPIGSKGSRNETWQVPVCVRYSASGALRESCLLLSQREEQVPLVGCPEWLFPNADAAGYYRWALAAQGLADLRGRGYATLSARERISYAQNLASAFRSGALPADVVLAALAPLAADENGAVASQPMDVLDFVHDEIADAALKRKVETEAQRLYGPVLARLGWRAAPGEPTEKRELRGKVVRFLALDMNDASVRAEAARLGRAYLGERVLARRALSLSFDSRLRQNERPIPFFVQLGQAGSRDGAWEFLRARFDALAPLLPDRYAGYLIASLFFCDADHAASVREFFTPRIERVNGGPRHLESALEKIELCEARVAAHAAKARAYFERKP
jgi:alanyl aminopeptidase